MNGGEQMTTKTTVVEREYNDKGYCIKETVTETES
jgi:hypothetical protein